MAVSFHCGHWEANLSLSLFYNNILKVCPRALHITLCHDRRAAFVTYDRAPMVHFNLSKFTSRLNETSAQSRVISQLLQEVALAVDSTTPAATKLVRSRTRQDMYLFSPCCCMEWYCWMFYVVILLNVAGLNRTTFELGNTRCIDEVEWIQRPASDCILTRSTAECWDRSELASTQTTFVGLSECEAISNKHRYLFANKEGLPCILIYAFCSSLFPIRSATQPLSLFIILMWMQVRMHIYVQTWNI